MSEHLQLITRKLQHLQRMHAYLDYSLGQAIPLMPIKSWAALTPENHETLAAFRVRFSEFRELRNAINHEYEENPERLSAFFSELTQAAPSLFSWHARLDRFCRENYQI